MMILFAFLVATLGVFLLNHQGSLTNKLAAKWFSLGCHLLSVIAFINIYGTARGIFIYLAALSIIGIALTIIGTVFPVNTDNKM